MARCACMLARCLDVCSIIGSVRCKVDVFTVIFVKTVSKVQEYLPNLLTIKTRSSLL